jgi:hypothetical protein
VILTAIPFNPSHGGAIFSVSCGQIVPDDDHGDASGQPNQNQADHVFVVSGKKGNCEKEHEDGPNDPVLNQGQTQHLEIPEYLAQFLVSNFSERWIHHQNKPDGNGDVGRTDLELIPEVDHSRKEISPAHTDKHREENPERQKPIQEREFSINLFFSHLQNPPL